MLLAVTEVLEKYEVKRVKVIEKNGASTSLTTDEQQVAATTEFSVQKLIQLKREYVAVNKIWCLKT